MPARYALLAAILAALNAGRSGTISGTVTFPNAGPASDVLVTCVSRDRFAAVRSAR